MNKINGGKHRHFNRNSVISFITENCKDTTPCQTN